VLRPSLKNTLDALFVSVQRAGPVFTGQAVVQPEAEGERFLIQLAPHAFNDNEVGNRTRKALGQYIRAYLKEEGWRVKTASFKKNYFELCVAESRASSRASQKRSAIL
jgi:hypothetical protein